MKLNNAGVEKPLHKILVVDDDPLLLQSLALSLTAERYSVLTATRGHEGLRLAEKSSPDLLLLEVMLPDVSGLDLCGALRDRGNLVPIILMTARSAESQLITGLEVGADDYLTKPFRPRVLLARIRARLRRHALQPAPETRRYRFSNMEIDFERQRVMRGGHAVELSSKEFEILALLVRYRGQVVTRHRLLAFVWRHHHPPTTRTVDNFMVKLRRKLEDDPTRPKHILSVYGDGYKFVSSDAAVRRGPPREESG